MENIKERIKQLLEKKGENPNSFSIKFGFSQRKLNRQINEDSKTVSLDVIQTLLSTFPDVNIEWLVMGNGEMLKQDPNIEISESKYFGILHGNHGVQKIGDNADLVKEQDKRLSQYENQFISEIHLFRDELDKFHNVQIKKDEYIERIIAKSFDRNQENMKRIDELISQNRTLIEYITKPQ